jgi:fructan beta-fructosidase
MLKIQLLLSFLLAGCLNLCAQIDYAIYHEPYRNQIHFSPIGHWMNDPNGMFYFKGRYHLFYQYYPEATVWGPMHWGHAVSKDLIHWQHLPIALYPDSLGYIFSGSAVVDIQNTSGFGKNGQIPLVAIFTQHDPAGEKAGTSTFQNQSIAYSIDNGKTWKKYSRNPVLNNPGIKDFRDPKVSWYKEGKKWIMTLATQDRISFYSSPNLKNWKKESEFGKEVGAHGGVWECPDLFSINYKGKKVWILLVSINPGGPNGGSATQYFTGTFDGHRFIPFQTDTRWIDYGPDDYAGVTWSNTGSRKIFLGWMSNWLYGTTVPTKIWRSAMTVPRELSLIQTDGKFYLSSNPVKELNVLNTKTLYLNNIRGKHFDLTSKTGLLKSPIKLNLDIDTLKSFAIELSNNKGEKLIVGFEKNTNQYYIDRTLAGDNSFNKQFAGKFTASRKVQNISTKLILIIDKASIELFADEGSSVMTSIFFPMNPYTSIHIISNDTVSIKKLEYTSMKGIW